MINDTGKTKFIISIFVIILLGIIIYKVCFKKEISSITLNKQYIEIYEGEKEQLEVKNSNNIGEMVWQSTNPGIVMVTSTGLIEGINAGEARIIVSSKNGKISNSCFVVVAKKELESFELSRKEILLEEGEEVEIIPIITPNDIEDEKVVWTSSDSSIIVVDENGKVKALKKGIAQVKGEILGKTASSVVYVGTKLESIKMEKNEEEIEIGKSARLTVIQEPNDALDETIKWESSDPNIVEVDEEGNIFAKNIGNAEITAKTEYSNLKDICYIMVTKKKYEVKFTELNKILNIKDGDIIGTLPTMNKEGYNFLGWYTSEKGGTKISSNTVVTANMILYPHWEMIYYLPKDDRYSSYSTVAFVDTETFKYRIIAYGSHDIVLVWVADAAKQLKQGLASPNAYGRNSAEAILSQVPSGNALVAVNASLFDEGTGTPNNGIIIHDGKVIKNKKGVGGCFGITSKGTLVDCTWQSLDGILKMNIINNFSMSHSIQAGKSDGTKATAHRTQICQVDEHNFALISASSIKTWEAAKILYTFSGNKCSVVYNLDGGGSRKLYYRTHGGGLIKRFGGSRAIPDMLYFTEQ